MRAWAEAQNAARALHHTAGPRRCPWPCKVPVKEDGDAELRIWPCEPYGVPRSWTARDSVWRDAMADLAATVACEIGCSVVLMWMGGETIERAVQAPTLRDQPGFLCWGKGETEPKGVRRREIMELRAKLVAKDLGIMPQGDDAWH